VIRASRREAVALACLVPLLAGVGRCSTVSLRGEAVATAKAMGKGAASGAYRELSSDRHKPR
jgi:hypothetical protein